MKQTKQYLQFLTSLKHNIIQSRYLAARLANREQLLLYFRIGKMLAEKIDAEKWGSKVVDQISEDLQKQLPGLRGFSRRNLLKMKQFFNDYQHLIIVPSPTAQLADKEEAPFVPLITAQMDIEALDAFWQVSFSHHIVLLTKCKSLEEKLFYIVQAAAQFWTVTIMEYQIDACLFKKQGKLPNNFQNTIAETLKTSALNVFKDEYFLDFMTGAEPEDERQIEENVVSNIRNFILQMGKGFCFIGNQFRLEVDGDEFFVDLLFYNRHLQCLVAFELKKGKFKPADAGQLSFYLNVLDEKVKLEKENSSIGIVLCKEKNNTVVEYAIKSFDKAMGVATYKTSKEVPNEIRRVLPDTDELAGLI